MTDPRFPGGAIRPPAAHDWMATDAWVRRGLILVVVFVGGFLLASSLLTISGAVVSSGIVNVDGNYKTIQHLDGGIVTEIAVEDGDTVEAGAKLLRLDATEARANLAVATARLDELLVHRARLEAERDRRDRILLPPGLVRAIDDPAITRIAASHHVLFEARRESREGERRMLVKRIEQTHAEMDGNRRQLAARREEARLVGVEVGRVEVLLQQGFATQLRLAALQKEASRLSGEIGRLSADTDRLAGAIDELQLRVVQSEKAHLEQVVDELRKLQAQIAEVSEQRFAAADRVRRAVVQAPYSGRVHGLTVHTVGGVVGPGATLMQIIPQGVTMLVEAQISPQDIDKVRTGHAAAIRFPAFDARSTPRIDGRVARVSPAELVDKQGRRHYTARIEFTPAMVARLGRQHGLVPGMPAEVYIETSRRSIMSYLLRPFTDAVYRTFREN